MQLLVDVGNSRIKWAFLEDGELRRPQVASHQNVNFDRFLHHIWRELECPEQVWIANVAGCEIQEALTSWITTTWHQHPLFLHTPSHAFGVMNGYHKPQTLGLDRWLGLIAAYNLYQRQKPVCVIDCGTCLTVDVVDRLGKHLGGLLLPGVNTMRQALSTYTDGCQMNAWSHDTSKRDMLAKNTQDGMVGGTLFAAVAYVERFFNEIRNEMGEEIALIMSGGEAQILMALLALPVDYRPNLVLEGMLLYVNEHQQVAVV